MTAIIKPLTFSHFIEVANAIEGSWFTTVALPGGRQK